MTDWYHHPGPDVTAHYQTLTALLRALPGLRGGVHVGTVPATLPQDTAGRVYPYAVIWAGILSPVPDDDVSGRIYQAGQAGEFTTTVASGDWREIFSSGNTTIVRLPSNSRRVADGCNCPVGTSAPHKSLTAWVAAPAMISLIVIIDVRF